MRECVIYARVSSKEQEREGYSIPAQLELLQSYAKRNGFTVLAEYSEAETAKSPGRARFNEMVGFLKARKKPTSLLVEKTDRLQRNLRDYITVDELVSQHGIEIHKVKEGTILNASAHSSERFMDLIKVGMAKQYIENLSEEVKKGHKQKVLQGGWPTLAPYGYRNNKTNHTIEVDPDTAPVVIRAFQLYATGLYSLEATIDQLEAEGYRYRPTSRRITRSRLHEVLQNQAYIGKVQFKGEVFQGNHTPLIDPITWAAVQRAFRKDSKPLSMNRRDFLFRGFATCGECGYAIVGELKKGKYVYYRCSGKKKNGCSQGYVAESVLNDAISAEFNGLVFPPDAKEKIRNGMKEMQAAVEQTANDVRDELNAQIKKLSSKRRTMYEDRLSERIDLPMWQEMDGELLEKIQTLEARMSNVTVADSQLFDNANVFVELPEILQGGWFEALPEEKRMILSFALSNCSIKNGKASLDLKDWLRSLKETKELIKNRK